MCASTRKGRSFQSGGVAYEIVSPYPSTAVDGIQFEPSFDVTYLTHEDYPPYKLSRLGATSWTLAAIDFVDGPYRDINDDQDWYIKPSGIWGNITLQMSTMPYPLVDGTWDVTQQASPHSMTSANPVLAVKLTAQETGTIVTLALDVLQECSLAGTVLTCSIHNKDIAGGIGTLLADADNECLVDTAGAKEFYFNTSVTDATDYWVVFTAVWPEGATTETIDITETTLSTYYPAWAGASTSTIVDLGVSVRFKIYLQTVTAKSGFYATHVGSLWRIRTNGRVVKVRFDSSLSGSSTSFSLDDLGAYLLENNIIASESVATSTPMYLYGSFTVDLSPYQGLTTDPPWVGHVVLEKSFDGLHYLKVASFYYSTKQEFFENKPGVLYRVRCEDYTSGVAYVSISQDEQWGVVEVTGYTSASLVSGTVIVPLGSSVATAEWREGAWSGYRGYPKASAFLDDRLWYGGVASQPSTFWGSWTGDYDTFMPEGNTDDSAITLTMLSRDAEAIQWMIPFRNGMGIGTMSSEWLMTSGAEGKAITAKNVTVQKHSTNGSAKDIFPIRIGDAILFAHRNRREIREMNYSFNTDSLDSMNLNQLADHILESGVNGMAFQQKPDPTLWCWRDDGEIACLVYNRKEEVVGWYRVVTDGVVESIACIPSSMGTH